MTPCNRETTLDSGRARHARKPPGCPPHELARQRPCFEMHGRLSRRVFALDNRRPIEIVSIGDLAVT